MARKLKVFRTHLGFYDLIVAAPSQKAALEAWGASPHIFAQGFAAVETGPRLVRAALEKPGVVLKRQFGSKGEFQESAGALRAPKASATHAAARRERAQRATAAERSERQAAKERAREEAVAAREAREEHRSAKQRQREAAAAERAEQRVAKARAKEVKARGRDKAKASAVARQGLQAKLQSVVQEMKAQLRDIERREDAVAKERREVEQSFETRIVSLRRKLRTLR